MNHPDFIIHAVLFKHRPNTIFSSRFQQSLPTSIKMELSIRLPRSENARIADEMERIRLNLVWTYKRLKKFVKENEGVIGRINSLQRQLYKQPDTFLLDDKEALDLHVYEHHVIEAEDLLALVLAMVGCFQLPGH